MEVLADELLRQCPEFVALIASAVFAELRLARAARFLGERGEVTAANDFNGVAAEVPRLQAAHVRALEALRLTPQARALLALRRPSGPSMAWTGMMDGETIILEDGEV